MNKKELIDKQELIDELAKYVKSYENAMDEHGQGRYGAYEVSLKLAKRLNEQNITDEQAWNKVAEAYPESAQSLRNTLDNAVFGKTGEHQKPVVPKFVADWFEENKDDLDNAIFGYLAFWEERYTDSFLEGFNYALLNAQDLEQIQLDDNQQIVLQWLKLTASTGKPMQVVFWMMNNAAWGQLDELWEPLMELTDKEQFEVLAAFAQWGLEQEEAE